MVLKNTLIFTLIRGLWFCSNSHYLLEIYTIDIIVSNEIIRSLGFAQEFASEYSSRGRRGGNVSVGLF